MVNFSTDSLNVVQQTEVGNLPFNGYLLECPLCMTTLLDVYDLDYEDLNKVKTWTVAQLVAWLELRARSGLTIKELLARTSGGQGEYVEVSDFHGMFVGIEKDGYTHS